MNIVRTIIQPVEKPPIEKVVLGKSLELHDGLYERACRAVMIQSNFTCNFCSENANRSSSMFEMIASLYFLCSAYSAPGESGKAGQSLTQVEKDCSSGGEGVKPSLAPNPSNTVRRTVLYSW
jgi:hypothetical protein